MTRPNNPAWQLDADGWLIEARRIDSPNRDQRPASETISLIVIHSISLPPGEFGGNAVIDFFTGQLDPTAHAYFAGIARQRVSAHFFIRRDGNVIQFVSCHERAWHAGVSCWRGRERCNDFSLGIELEGDERVDYDDAQYRALVNLLRVLREKYPIEAIAGHADIAPGRKADPGPHFDWSRIAIADTLR